MADYLAVLNRTLSGFGEPNVQLRRKLYERARLTIKRQLDGRQPPLEESAVIAEMQKLESAIEEIESGFPDSMLEVEPTPPPLPTRAEVQPAPAAPPAAAVSTPAQAVEQPAPAPPPVQTTPTQEPVAPPPPRVEPAPAPIEPAVDDWNQQQAVAPAPDPITEAISEFTEVEQQRKDAQAESQAAEVAPGAENLSDSEAFSQFFEAETQAIQTPVASEPVAAPVAEQPVAPNPSPPPVDKRLPPVADLQPIDFGAGQGGDNLSIPPAAPVYGGEPSRIGSYVRKGLMALLILLGVAGLAYGGWLASGPIMSLIGDSGDDATAPKPVKTITIRPEPAQPETDNAPTEEVAPQKLEQRLTDDGVELDSSQPLAPVDENTDEQTALGTEQVAENTQTDPIAQEAAAGAQRALLYEESGTANGGTLDAGSAVWSVVQGDPGAGKPEEPAIRGQIEIPDRKAVLIMTIKRNADPALTASHLIELIFATPEDFSGGSIETVNRFVLKESEGGRGASLNGVPVKITQGHFWIALDNLDDARQANETLLKTRDWIDIPLQYRTGRRALITIEKGDSGKAVFDEVFSHWDNNAL